MLVKSKASHTVTLTLEDWARVKEICDFMRYDSASDAISYGLQQAMKVINALNAEEKAPAGATSPVVAKPRNRKS